MTDLVSVKEPRSQKKNISYTFIRVEQLFVSWSCANRFTAVENCSLKQRMEKCESHFSITLVFLLFPGSQHFGKLKFKMVSLVFVSVSVVQAEGSME